MDPDGLLLEGAVRGGFFGACGRRTLSQGKPEP
jgi:hypothetical protein